MSRKATDENTTPVRFRVHFDDAMGRPDHQDIDATSPAQAESQFRSALASAALDGSQVRVRKIKQVRQ